MMNKLLLRFGLVSLLSAASVSSAQTQIPVLGDLLAGSGGGLLILGDLLGGDVLPTNNLLGKAGLLSTQLEQILGDPLAEIPTGLDSKLIFGFVPGVEVLYNNPLGIIDFLLAGNSFLAESLFIVPAIPLVSSGLDLGALDILGGGGLSLGGLPGLEGGGLLSPAELLPQILIPLTSL